MTFSRIVQRICTVFAIVASLGVATHAQAGRGPSTAEERTRVVQLALAADKDPIAIMTSADGRWFEKWVEEVPEYMFGPDNGAFWFMSGAAKGDLMRVLRFHHTISAAAYQVQHGITDPRANADQMAAKTLAGVEGLLRAYESLRDKRPENRSAKLDEAIAMRDQGGLAAFVKALPPMPEQ